VAFDILSGVTTAKSWARGDVVVDLISSRAKKLPWEKIFIGAGIVGGVGLLALFATNPEHRGRRELRRHDDPRFERDEWAHETQEIPRQKMRELVSRNGV